MAGYLKALPPLGRLPFDLTMILGMALWAVVLGHATRRLQLSQRVPPILGIFLLLAVPLVWTSFTPYAIEKTTRFFALTTLACLAPIVLLERREDLERMIFSWAGICSVVIAMLIVYPSSEGTYAGAPLETNGTNTIGIARAGGIALTVGAIGLLHRRTPWSLSLAAILASALAMLQAGARGPLLALIVTLGLSIVLIRVRRRALVLGGLFALVIGSLWYAYRLAPIGSQARILNLATGTFDDSSLARVQLFAMARHAIATHLVFGLGWGGYERIAPTPYRYPHNLPIEILAEAGAPIGILVLAWIAFVWVRARRNARDFPTATAFALLTFTLVNAMVSGDVNENRMLFLAIGLVVAAISTSGVANASATPGFG